MREAELDKLMASSPPAMKKQEEGEEEAERFMYPVGNLSYFCKICNKRFGSGRALGGHMRAHGPVAMAAEKKERALIEVEKEEEEEEEEEEVGGNGSDDNNGGSLIYTLRRNPKRSWRFADREFSSVMAESRHISSNSPVCDVCGKEFPSWKSLFGHMKCHSDRFWKIHQDVGDSHSQKSEAHQSQDNEEGEEGMENDSEGEIEQHPESSPDGISGRFDSLMKGKRSKRPRYVIQPHSSPTHQNSGQKEQFSSGNNSGQKEQFSSDNNLGQKEQFSSDNNSGQKEQFSSDNNSGHKEQFSSDNSEEEDMAICLVMLASGVNAATQKLEANDGHVPKGKEEGNKDNNAVGIKKRPKTKVVEANGGDGCDGDAKRTKYECATCNKAFHSYQALGGHRASHKKIKGCFSRVDVQEENESLEEEITDEEHMTRSDSQLPNNSPKPCPAKEHTKVSEESGETTIQPALVSAAALVKKTRIHECSICHRVFSSGQALGGHKRCHWGSTGTSDTISTVSSTKELPQQQQRPARMELLDLNLPAPVDDDSDARQFNGLGGNFVNSHRPSDAETHSKIIPPIFQSWWMGTYPKQGLFWYNKQSPLPIEDEADSNQGMKIAFGRVEDSQVTRAHSWLQL